MLAQQGDPSVGPKDSVIDAITRGGDLLCAGRTGDFLYQLSGRGLAQGDGFFQTLDAAGHDFLGAEYLVPDRRCFGLELSFHRRFNFFDA